MRVKKPVQVVCVDCGCEFIAYSRAALRCEKCKEENLRLKKKKSQEKCRGVYKNHKKLKPKMSIGEVLTMLKDYNEENSTNLSYGKFVLLLERGLVK